MQLSFNACACVMYMQNPMQQRHKCCRDVLRCYNCTIIFSRVSIVSTLKIPFVCMCHTVDSVLYLLALDFCFNTYIGARAHALAYSQAYAPLLDSTAPTAAINKSQWDGLKLNAKGRRVWTHAILC